MEIRSNASSIKLQVVHCKTTTLFKRWYTRDVFLKMHFLKQVVFGANLWRNLFVADLQSEHYRLTTLLTLKELEFAGFYFRCDAKLSSI